MPQVVYKPGGLSGAAHAVHILICVFTCGLWLPGYLIFIAAAPKRRIEVIAPYGIDPQLIARARAEAEGPVLPLRPSSGKTNWAYIVGLVLVFAVTLAICIVIGTR